MTETLNWISNAAAFDLLMKAVHDKVPFSLLRFVDGEGMFIGGGIERERILETWFGHHNFPAEQLEQLEQDVIAAFRSADVVGLPGEDSSDVFLKAVEQFREKRLFASESTPVTPPSIHWYAGEPDRLRQLFSQVEDVFLVTSRDVESLLKHRYGVKSVKTYLIPTEAAWAGAEIEEHFPKRYKELKETIHVPYNGALFLVGGGICGKVYCNWLRQRGAVAIDVGSLFDMWAGKLTRYAMNAEQAIDNVRVALEVTPHNAEKHADMAMLLHRKGDLAMAAIHYRAAIEIEPNPVWLRGLSRLLMTQGDAQGALALAEEAVTVAENDTELLMQLADLYRQLGKDALQMEFLQRAELAIKERVKGRHLVSDPYRQLSIALDRQGRLVEAVEAAENAVTSSVPDNAYLRFHCSLLYRKKGDFDSAFNHLKRATEIAPNDPALAHQLGNIAADRGMVLAVEMQKRVIEKAPHIAGAHYLLSKAQVYLDSFDDALVSAEEATRLEPDNQAYARHLTRVRQALSRRVRVMSA